MGIVYNSGMWPIIVKAFNETLTMVFFSTVFSVVIGFIPAIILTLTAPDGLKPNKAVYETLSFVVNVFRSFPFLILIVISASKSFEGYFGCSASNRSTAPLTGLSQRWVV